jgi:CxxC motif-containing protein (DUF1111 family)
VDGVTGRPAFLSDLVTTTIGTNFVGRFGWKCQQSTLVAFSGDAYLNEMGVTDRLFTKPLPCVIVTSDLRRNSNKRCWLIKGRLLTADYADYAD